MSRTRRKRFRKPRTDKGTALIAHGPDETMGRRAFRNGNGHRHSAFERLLAGFIAIDGLQHFDLFRISVSLGEARQIGEDGEDDFGRLFQSNRARDRRSRGQGVTDQKNHSDDHDNEDDKVEYPFHRSEIAKPRAPGERKIFWLARR